MILRKHVVATCLAIAFPFCVAHAEPVNLSRMTLGYTYFNRSGADLAAHDKALTDCLVDASKVHSVDEQLNDNSMGVLGNIIAGALADAAHRGVLAAALENCMVVNGWRVVHLPDDEGATLAKLPASELAQRLAPWVGADVPHGDIVRIWGNDAVKGATDRFVLRPAHTNNGQLSLKAASGGNLRAAAKKADAPVVMAAAAPASSAAKPSKPAPLDPKWPKKPLKPGELATAPPEAGIVLVDIKGLSFHNGQALLFARQGPDKHTPASSIDHGPDQFAIGVGLLFAKKDGNIMAFAVPPGRWRIAGQAGGLIMVSYCLGAPSFELKAGEVIYAGTFDFGADVIGPDLSLAPAKAWLAGQPAAETIKPAVYTNGATGECGPNYIYALEVSGAPFEPGYVLGSAAPLASSGATH